MSTKSPITTHALDTRSGKPAAGLPITLFGQDKESWIKLAAGVTNEDGRITDLLKPGSLTPGIYKMYFDTSTYHQQQSVQGFYPEVNIIFEIKSVDEHYHIPLLLSPFGYSTYRGS